MVRHLRKSCFVMGTRRSGDLDNDTGQNLADPPITRCCNPIPSDRVIGGSPQSNFEGFGRLISGHPNSSLSKELRVHLAAVGLGDRSARKRTWMWVCGGIYSRRTRRKLDIPKHSTPSQKSLIYSSTRPPMTFENTRVWFSKCFRRSK